jgi:hypothetical protein
MLTKKRKDARANVHQGRRLNVEKAAALRGRWYQTTVDSELVTVTRDPIIARIQDALRDEHT